MLHSAAVLYRAVEPLYEDSSGTIAALDSLPETVEALTQITEALDDIEGLLGTSSPRHVSLLLPHFPTPFTAMIAVLAQNLLFHDRTSFSLVLINVVYESINVLGNLCVPH